MLEGVYYNNNNIYLTAIGYSPGGSQIHPVAVIHPVAYMKMNYFIVVSSQFIVVG